MRSISQKTGFMEYRYCREVASFPTKFSIQHGQTFPLKA
ncbi:MAG: hypothetical protein JETT_0126 [Candidatus Jettenia ecosi]|uniref:Uncharacterized protein n=1 Tax=Candidatus Jettenia ecosi TaxID=2494326 RepID=A0A533QFD7_9BACT|nr:MAG: hypothetical protein JETT_0126 [Candidatus Jettenia ecosi]